MIVARYIDAGKAREVGKYIPWCESDLVEKAIDRIPTAKVDPVEYAHWKFDGFGEYHCSGCLGQVKVPERLLDGLTLSKCPYLRCPWCGAHMIEEDEEDEVMWDG